MERRWHHADRAGLVRRRKIRVTFEAHQPNQLPYQHAWIGRAMRFMAGLASFESDRAMFEGERTPLVAMAAQAARLVRSEALRHRGPDTAVRIVAIDAAHRPLRQLVMFRALKLRPYVGVASGAHLIDRGGFSNHQRLSPVGVNLMTGGAGDRVFGVAALQTPHLRGSIQVAGEADLVRG